MSARPQPWPGGERLLEIRDLRVEFRTKEGLVHAVNDIAYDLDRDERLGLVGESGSGKSASALSILGLLPSNARVSGAIRFEGRDLVKLSDAEMRNVRGAEIAMIYQDPFSSLNPVLTVERQLSETISAHRRVGAKEARSEAIRLMELVGIPDAARRIKSYPHQFSGGMRQRVMVAMALSASPRLLIADEPTTALDVTIQAQILELLLEVTDREGMALILITHDLGIVARVTRRLLVMYAGRIVESGATSDLFRSPAHPYTVGLLNSLPRVDRRQQRLPTIEGQPPDMSLRIRGCPFAPRCSRRLDHCTTADPPLVPIGFAAARLADAAPERLYQGPDPVTTGPNAAHLVACWNPMPLGVGGPRTTAGVGPRAAGRATQISGQGDPGAERLRND